MITPGTAPFIVFGGVFVLAGIFMMVQGIRQLDGSGHDPWYVLFFMGLVFASVGSGLAWYGARMRSRWTRAQELKQQHPTEPWLRTDEWRDRRIRHNASGGAIGLWVFAIFWNGFVAIAAAGGGDQIIAEAAEEPTVWIALLFPVVGIGMLVAAVRRTIHWRRFGTSSLVLQRLPVPIGGVLEGALELPNDVPEAENLVVRLTCTRTVRRGRNSTTTPVWSDEQVYARASMGVGPAGPTLAIRFAIPAEAPATTVESPNTSIRWQLLVSAAVSGVDFSADYAVPVFRTTEAPATESTDLSLLPRPASERQRGVTHRTILREAAPGGGSMWRFGAFRAPGVTLFFAAFTGIWTGISYLLFAADAPMIFPAFFRFFEVILVLAVLDLALGRCVIVAHRGQLVVQSGLVVLWKTRTITADEIKEFRIKSGMTFGSTVYYNIQVRRTLKGKVRLGTRLRSLGEAEEICDEMQKAIGIHPLSAEPPRRA